VFKRSQTSPMVMDREDRQETI